MKRDIQCYLWRRAVVSCDDTENAFVYAMMELAAVWAVSPEKTVHIELIGRIEKVGSMWEAKDWMKKIDWDQCMAAIEDRNRRETNGLQESEVTLPPILTS